MSATRTFLVDFLCVLFGIGTWVCVNGVWVELPLLVPALPEGWNLPSYMSVVVQIANIGPLTFSILHSLFPKYIRERPAIYLTMTIGCASSILLAFFWDTTGNLVGENRSTALLGLLFCLAMVDCSSRVLFLPFMAAFKEMYLTSFFIGEGLSGFLPSVFALVQGVGGNPSCSNVTKQNETDTWTEIQAVYPDPRFSVAVFFFLLFGLMVVSAVAFQLLNQKAITKGSLVEVVHPHTNIVLLGNGNGNIPSYQSTSLEQGRVGNNFRDIDGDNGSESGSDYGVNFSSIKSRRMSGDEDVAVKDAFFSHISKPVFFYLLIIQAMVCCFSNGILPSIQSYSCLPYGNVAYHWAVTLSSIANPAVCFLAIYVPPPTKVTITNVMLLGFLTTGYVLTTALLSPIPPLVDVAMGEILLVLSWILVVGFFTYVKVSVATILRSEGKRGLFWCGAVTQLGSAIGATVTFGVVNYTNTFESYYPCQRYKGF